MAPSTAGRREWTALAVLCLPLLIVSMDVSVLFFAVPHIAEELAPTATQMLWIFDIYGFVLAGLLLTMGNVADRMGRRRLLLLGAFAFGAASVVAAYAPGPEWLILARALLGVGGSTLMPSTLAIIRNLFAEPAQRAKAVGIWSAVLAGGVGIGPVVAGILLEHYWWGSVFLINVPFMLVLLAIGPFLLPESRSETTRVDLLSSVLSLTAVLPVIQALKEFAADGWAPVLVGYLGVGAVAGFLFVWRQGMVRSPMVDLTLFGAQGFGGSIVIQVIGMFGMMGSAILTTQYIQSVLGYSALSAALWSLVPSLLVGGAAPGAAAVAARIGRPPVMAFAFTVAALGFLGIRFAQVESSIWVVLVAASLVAMGLVAVAALVTEYAIGVAPADRSGSVSALVETASELGGALGMAVLGSVLAAVYGSTVSGLLPSGLPEEVSASVGETLGGATVAAGQVGGETGAAILEAAQAAYVSGMHAAVLCAAAAAVLGALVALTALPRHVIHTEAPDAAHPPTRVAP
ncbi:MFS transporter [Intrasporangium calvum]|uniref:MFS transporter n=1 Tax=Intrasporangium calvum TaxID=53358 RepID=A0ABT5GKX4_9MICO|nr:MFS transporter [Intrasporangium calvum]MDC5698550.1 MFS transporter [Intrasporangium calvum]